MDIPGFESGEISLCPPTGCNHVRVHDSPWDEMGRPVGPKLEFFYPCELPIKAKRLQANEDSESLNAHFSNLPFKPEFSDPDTWLTKSYNASSSGMFQEAIVRQGNLSYLSDHKADKNCNRLEKRSRTRSSAPSNKWHLTSPRNSPSYAIVTGSIRDKEQQTYRTKEEQRWTGNTTQTLTNNEMQYLCPVIQKSPLQRTSSSPERLESHRPRERSTYTNNPSIRISCYNLHDEFHPN